MNTQTNRRLKAVTPDQFNEMKQAALDLDAQVNAIRATANVLKEWFPEYDFDIETLYKEDIKYIDIGYADIPIAERIDERRLNFMQRCISFIKYLKEHQ